MQTNNIKNSSIILDGKLDFQTPRGPSHLSNQKWNLATNCQKKNASVNCPSNFSKRRLQPMFQQNLRLKACKKIIQNENPNKCVVHISQKHLVHILVWKFQQKQNQYTTIITMVITCRPKFQGTNLKWRNIISRLNSMLCSQN
jgi:hypothetical protein